MTDREKVIHGLELVKEDICERFTSGSQISIDCLRIDKAIALLKEQEVRIQKYEYVFDFLGIGFRQWATKILDGEAEAICETDEHEYKTVVTFKLI